MRNDEILKLLKPEDLLEGSDVFVDYLKEFNIYEIDRQGFYVGDGLDIFRYLIQNFDGIVLSLPSLRNMPNLKERYVSKRLQDNPKISTKRLAVEMNCSERSVRRYKKSLHNKLD